MKACAATTASDGTLKPVGALESAADVCVANGVGYVSYTYNERLRKQGHQHWMMAPYKNAYLFNANIAPIIEDSRISGIVWLTDWRSLETSKDTYSWTSLDSALNRCAALGKKLIIRCIAKTYSGTVTDTGSAVVTPLAVPDYIATDPATYGGVMYKSGLYPVYISAVQVGWGAFLENDAVRARWKLLVEAIYAHAGSHAAFAGWIGPDESTRSAYTGSGLPAGMTSTTIVAANKDMWTHDMALFGASKMWPVVNYIDSTDTISVSNQTAVDMQTWCINQGMNISVSDTYVLDKNSGAFKLTQFLQPVYYSTPRPDIATERKHLVHVDLLSLGANDGTLGQRMIDTAIQTYRLGADITAWNPYTADAGGNAAYWTAMQAAIDATTAYRS